jgi:hypothetical protein
MLFAGLKNLRLLVKNNEFAAKACSERLWEGIPGGRRRAASNDARKGTRGATSVR